MLDDLFRYLASLIKYQLPIDSKLAPDRLNVLGIRPLTKYIIFV